MAKITFSVVVTILNEADTINRLLDSLINQSEPPDEIVIVDGGSTDKTVALVQAKMVSAQVKCQLFFKPGFNRSQSRNYGIDKAVNEHIAVTDAGCEADRQWLAELARGFYQDTDVVAGYYAPVIDRPIQKLFAAYVAVSPDHFDIHRFLPSSRSIAFTKKIWRMVGKYPEYLDTCEDLVFAERLKFLGTMTVWPNALVYWQQAKNIHAFFRQIKGYARGDVMAKYRPHVVKILTVWGRYIVFVLMPPLFLVYLFYPIWKMRQIVNKVDDAWMLPLVQLTADVAVMAGSLSGLATLRIFQT